MRRDRRPALRMKFQISIFLKICIPTGLLSRWRIYLRNITRDWCWACGGLDKISLRLMAVGIASGVDQTFARRCGVFFLFVCFAFYKFFSCSAEDQIQGFLNIKTCSVVQPSALAGRLWGETFLLLKEIYKKRHCSPSPGCFYFRMLRLGLPQPPARWLSFQMKLKTAKEKCMETEVLVTSLSCWRILAWAFPSSQLLAPGNDIYRSNLRPSSSILCLWGM